MQEAVMTQRQPQAVPATSLQEQHAQLCAQGLKINMTRGVPSNEQLALSQALLSAPVDATFKSRDGVDWRNYGGLQGLPEVRELFAGPLLGLAADAIAVGENSSLALMHETLDHAFRRGVPGGERPWSKEPRVKFICPVPGYDRHFAMCEEFGIEMIPVPLLETGPDMQLVEALVAADPAIKGMWCIPKYSNPTGVTYSAETVGRLASMPTAAADFRLFWDNAYAVHHLTDARPLNADINGLSAAAGHADRAFLFASTSKITLAGSGLAFFGASPQNLAWWLERRKFRTIGPDKVNQVRHLQFFGNAEGLARHMAAHQALLAPKFACVDQAFTEAFGDTPEVRWTQPAGGYFVSLDVKPGCAKRTVELARQAGIALTPAGAPFPGGLDPADRNIRISPSFVELEVLGQACKAVALCAALAAQELA